MHSHLIAGCGMPLDPHLYYTITLGYIKGQCTVAFHMQHVFECFQISVGNANIGKRYSSKWPLRITQMVKSSQLFLHCVSDPLISDQRWMVSIESQAMCGGASFVLGLAVVFMCYYNFNLQYQDEAESLVPDVWALQPSLHSFMYAIAVFNTTKLLNNNRGHSVLYLSL